jgi:hypothetical protein
MKEIQCLKVDYKKIVVRAILDFIVIAVLLFLIAFMESFIKDLGNSFSYIFKEKLLLFFILIVFSILLTVVISFIEISARCLSLKYDDEKIIFVKNKKEESVRLTYDLYVRAELKNNSVVFSFRQNKRVTNAYLSDIVGAELIEHLKAKEIGINIINKDKKEEIQQEIDKKGQDK